MVLVASILDHGYRALIASILERSTSRNGRKSWPGHISTLFMTLLNYYW